MPRVHFVKAARKDVQNSDIKKGESYYWWKFRFGGKHVSRTPPKQSQLTQSDFLAAIYDLQDRIAGLTADETLPDEVNNIADELRSLADEQEDKRSNMPDSLQDGEVGQMLENRAQSTNDMADELEGLDFDLDEESLREEAKDEIGKYEVEKHGTQDDHQKLIDEAYETKVQEFWESKLEEVQGIDYQGD